MQAVAIRRRPAAAGGGRAARRSRTGATRVETHHAGRGHPVGGERTQQGHSIGWWENETLVVDSSLFSDHRTGNGPGIPSGAQKHVLERYTLSEDRRRITLDILLEDEEYLAEPLSGTIEWIFAPELQLYSYNCAQDVSRAFRQN